MRVKCRSIIKVNNVIWNIIDSINMIIERCGIQARLIFKTRNSGKMVGTNVVNGRIRSVPFTTR